MAQQQFYNACTNGDLDTLKTLLSPDLFPRYNTIIQSPKNIINTLIFPTLLYNFSIHIACKNGHLDIVRTLLTYEPMHSYVDLCMSNHFALRIACKKGYSEIVRQLLLFRIHYVPHDLHSSTLTFAIRLAAQNGNTEIVKMLELPQLFTVFIKIDVANIYEYITQLDYKVQCGQYLRDYQDLLSKSQRKILHDFMSTFFCNIGLFLRLPTDVVRYICGF